MRAKPNAHADEGVYALRSRHARGTAPLPRQCHESRYIGPSRTDPAKATGGEDEMLAVFRASRDDIRRRVADLMMRIGPYPPTGARS